MGALLDDMKFKGSSGFYLGDFKDEIVCYGNDSLQLLFYSNVPRVNVQVKGLMDVELGDCCAVSLIRNVLKLDNDAWILKDILNTWMREYPFLLLTE